MADTGIKISLPNTNVLNTDPQNVIFDSKNPFIKIDTQNTVGFQTINLTFINDPPEDTYTVVYSFAHGYTYTPSLETLFFVTSPQLTAVSYQQYFQDGGTLSSQSAFDGAVLYAVADGTNVYFIVWKFNSGGSPNPLTGVGVRITSHVFVDDYSNS